MKYGSTGIKRFANKRQTHFCDIVAKPGNAGLYGEKSAKSFPPFPTFQVFYLYILSIYISKSVGNLVMLEITEGGRVNGFQ